MTLTQLQVLVAVAEEKSFTRAAESLGFTQSAVSQMVNNLEKELGIMLFQRSRSGISPTYIGERMIQHAREILRITSCMKEEASASLGLEAGKLRIGAIPSVSAKVLPGLLGSFRKRFPQIEIVLFEGGYEEVNSWISGSVVDVGFTTMPVKELQSFPLLQDQMMVFVPNDHPLKGEPFLTFDHIKDKCFIMVKEQCIKELLKEHGIVPNVTFEVSDPATILSMVQEWIGVTILPELFIPEALPNVTAIPLRPAITRKLVLAVLDCQRVSPVAAEFIVHSQNYVKHIESFD